MISALVAAHLSVVTDVPRCVARTNARLEKARREAGQPNSAENEVYILYASRGNVSAAKRYMRRHNYDLLTSRDRREIVFTAHLDLETGYSPFRPGLRLACTASKLSGVPFRAVDRHNGTVLIYSVSAN